MAIGVMPWKVVQAKRSDMGIGVMRWKVFQAERSDMGISVMPWERLPGQTYGQAEPFGPPQSTDS